MDLTPTEAAQAGYDHIEIYHCQLTVHLWLTHLPDRPLSRMRFRCQRCDARLSAAEAGAHYGRQADMPGVMAKFRYPR